MEVHVVPSILDAQQPPTEAELLAYNTQRAIESGMKGLDPRPPASQTAAVPGEYITEVLRRRNEDTKAVKEALIAIRNSREWRNSSAKGRKAREKLKLDRLRAKRDEEKISAKWYIDNRGRSAKSI